MLVVADHLGVEAVLEEVAAALVAAVERLGVSECECVHAVRDTLELAEHDEVESGCA